MCVPSGGLAVAANPPLFLRIFAGTCLAALLICAPLGAQHPDSAKVIKGTRIDVSITGKVCIVDADRHTVTTYGQELVRAYEIGGQGWENDQFDRPLGLWARNGIDVFVADYGNHRIQRFDRSLNFVASLSTRDNENPDERFGYPADVALSRLGDLYICDTENTRIVKVNRFSRVERVFGGFDAGKGRLQHPRQLEIGPGDYVYVLDAERIAVYDSFGNYLHDFGSGLFGRATCLFADGDGIIVCDEQAIQFFDRHGRLVSSTPKGSVPGLGEAEIRGVGFFRETMYILTSHGLVLVRSPRGKPPAQNVDKE